MTDRPVLVWFRQDLRLADNSALAAAAGSGAPIVPVFVLDDDTPGRWAWGGASRWWLHGSLASLAKSLDGLGQRLVLRRGAADREIERLVRETDAAGVFWNRCYEPFAIDRDQDLEQRLCRNGVDARSFNASLLREPWEVTSKQGGPLKVYSPYWRALNALGEPPLPTSAPSALRPWDGAAESDHLDAWRLRPTKPDWAGGLRETWVPGELGALDRLEAFLDGAIRGYGTRRNEPGADHVSRLSPRLHWGEIGPRQVWHAVHARAHADDAGGIGRDAEHFLKELVWREFSHNLLYHFPDLPDASLRPEFDDFPWAEVDGAQHDRIEAWRQGRTGYPIVDAGMRELWHTGYMHNRVRMIAASFLVKDLLVDWRVGEAWFWDTLVDADLANNAASWQWVAGCGADAAPFFRVFNPVLQGEKFDPDGTYVRRWVAELTDMPDRFVHKPWEAPELVLRETGVELGRTYPTPIVDHSEARKTALAAFETIKRHDRGAA